MDFSRKEVDYLDAAYFIVNDIELYLRLSESSLARAVTPEVNHNHSVR